ncbi:hypothetical protein HDG33_001411 [Paraburkholderia sp. Cpub6]|nr:hypothetical protein [Paraburkholderia sp. Cpub6]
MGKDEAAQHEKDVNTPDPVIDELHNAQWQPPSLSAK